MSAKGEGLNEKVFAERGGRGQNVGMLRIEGQTVLKLVGVSRQGTRRLSYST